MRITEQILHECISSVQELLVGQQPVYFGVMIHFNIPIYFEELLEHEVALL